MASGSFSGSIINGKFELQCYWSSTPNTATNTSSVSVTCYLIIAQYWSLDIGPRDVSVVINGTSKTFESPSITRSGYVKIKLGTTSAVSVTHNSDGKKSISISATFPIRATISGTYYSNIVANGTAVLDDIPRSATITSAPDFNDTQNPTIQYSNPAGTVVESLQACISLTGASADIAYRDISKTGTSYTFNLTDAERNLLRQNTSGKTRKVRFYVATTIGGTIYRDYQEVTFTVVKAEPTFSCSYLDTNSTTVGITQNNQYIIRNNSTLRVNITNAQAYKYATLRSAKVTINGVEYTGTFSGNSSVINIGVLNVSSNVSASVTVTDSRGYTTTKTLNILVYDWINPSAIISMARVSNYYSETDITVDGSISSLGGNNTMTIQYRTKKVGTSTWGSWGTLQDNVQSQFTADNNYQWDVQVKITDRIGSTTYNLMLNRGIPLVFFDMIKNSTGFNCFPVGTETVEVNGEDVLDKFTGIGGIAKSARTSDWNTAGGMQTGIYMGSSMSHAPANSSNWFFVLHIVHNDKYQRQVAFDFFSINIWTRRMDNGNWDSSWTQVL
jgi:hypothetical protein